MICPQATVGLQPGRMRRKQRRADIEVLKLDAWRKRLFVDELGAEAHVFK